VAVGGDVNNIIASADGITWANLVSGTGQTWGLGSIIYADARFVAIGGGGIFTSKSGTNNIVFQKRDDRTKLTVANNGVILATYEPIKNAQAIFKDFTKSSQACSNDTNPINYFEHSFRLTLEPGLVPNTPESEINFLSKIHTQKSQAGYFELALYYLFYKPFRQKRYSLSGSSKYINDYAQLDSLLKGNKFIDSIYLAKLAKLKHNQLSLKPFIATTDNTTTVEITVLHDDLTLEKISVTMNNKFPHFPKNRPYFPEINPLINGYRFNNGCIPYNH
jgi:hypothetical protein